MAVFAACRRLVLSMLAVLLLAPAAIEAGAAESPSGFIQDLGDKAVLIINDHALTNAESRTKFATLFEASFDVPGIAQYVLGHYWDHATDQEHDEYLGLFRRYIVGLYSGRFAAYSGEKFRVIDAHEDGDATMVASELTGGANGQATHIDWLVRNTPEGFRIGDVVLDQVSLEAAQRAEFTSIIVHGDGSIATLIAALRDKLSHPQN